LPENLGGKALKSTVLKLAGLAVLIVGVAGTLSAFTVPEIDAATGANALALLSGALLIIRSRKR
jgi:hypothetical protein